MNGKIGIIQLVTLIASLAIYIIGVLHNNSILQMLSCIIGIFAVLWILIRLIRSSNKEEKGAEDKGRIDDIDKLAVTYEDDSNNHLREQIYFINNFYRQSEWIITAIADRDIKKLYNRKNYLTNNKYILKQGLVISYTVITSLLTTCVVNISECFSKTPIKWLNIVAAVLELITLICLIHRIVIDKATDRLKDSQQYIRQYELKLLDEKIEKLQQLIVEKSDLYKPVISNINDEAVNVQQIAFKQELKASVQKSIIRISRRDRIRLGREIDRMDLSITDNSRFNREIIEINGIYGYLFYEKGSVQEPELRVYKELEQLVIEYGLILNIKRNVKDCTVMQAGKKELSEDNK